MASSSFSLLVSAVAVLVPFVDAYMPAFAFTYTDGQKNADFFQTVSSEGYKAVYVYAGDVETYCRGVAGSSASTPCYFSGPNTNSWVYYTQYSQDTVKKFAAAGFQVYLNWDGRIGGGGFVANMGSMSPAAIQGMANATASWACNDPNVAGLGWDVEPYNNNQVPYFAALSQYMTACKKRWGIFTFPQALSTQMWHTFGDYGFVFDSSYDLTTPCECIAPAQYEGVLGQQLAALTADAAQYNVDYQILLSGSGTTTIYTQYTGGNQCLGGGTVYNYTCPYTMEQWMQSAMNALDKAKVKSDSHFLGVGVYDYTDSSNGGFLPTNPPTQALAVIKQAGYWNGA